MSNRISHLIILFGLVIFISVTASAIEQPGMKTITSVKLKLQVTVPRQWICTPLRDDFLVDDEDLEEIDGDDDSDEGEEVLCAEDADKNFFLGVFSEVDKADAYPEGALLWAELMKEKLLKHLSYPQLLKHWSDPNMTINKDTLHTEPAHEDGISGAFIEFIARAKFPGRQEGFSKSNAFVGRNKDRVYGLKVVIATDRADDAMMDLTNKILDSFATYELSPSEAKQEIQGVWEISFNETTQATLEITGNVGILTLRIADSSGVIIVIQNVTIHDPKEYKGRKISRGLYLLGSQPLLAVTQKPATNYSERPDELFFQKQLDGSYRIWRSFEGGDWKHARVKTHRDGKIAVGRGR